MQAAIWSIPSTSDSSPGEDNLSSAPALELQTRIDTSSHGDVKRFAVYCRWYFKTNFKQKIMHILLVLCCTMVNKLLVNFLKALADFNNFRTTLARNENFYASQYQNVSSHFIRV